MCHTCVTIRVFRRAKLVIVEVENKYYRLIMIIFRLNYKKIVLLQLLNIFAR